MLLFSNRNWIVSAVCLCLFSWVMAGIFNSPDLLQAQDQARPAWFERSIVGMEVGTTGAQFGYSDPEDTRYCELWDGREIVRRCVESNAEYLVLWLRDGDYAYYDSRILPKAPGLGERDPLREALDEAKKHRLVLRGAAGWFVSRTAPGMADARR